MTKFIKLTLLILLITGNLYASGASGGGTGGGSFSGTFNDLFPGTDDKVIVHNGTDWQTKSMADCDAAGGIIQYDTTTNNFSCHTLADSDLPALATHTDDSILVGSGTVWQLKTIPDCNTVNNNAIQYDTATNAFTCVTISVALDTSADFVWTGNHDFQGGVTKISSGGFMNFVGTTVVTPSEGDLWYDGSFFRASWGDATNEQFLHGDASDDKILIGDGTTYVEKALANCVGTDFLQYSTSTNVFTCGTGGGGGSNHNLFSTTHSDTTGAGTETRGDLIARNGSSQWARLAIGSANQVLHGGTDPTWSSITDADVPDTITISGANKVALTALAGGTNDDVLVSNGTDWIETQLPSCSASGEALNYNAGTNAWSCRTITTGGCTVHNLLDGSVHGDTAVHTAVLGDIIYVNSTPVYTSLAGNTTAIKKFLRQTGNGSVSAAPAWDTIVDGDVPDTITIDGTNNVSLASIAVGSDDTVLVSNGTIQQSKAVPDCDDSAGQHLNYDTATNAWSCGTTGTGAGSSNAAIHLFDEFLNGNSTSGSGYGNLGFACVVSGTAASCQQDAAGVATEAVNHPGVLSLDTGTSGTGRAILKPYQGTLMGQFIGGGAITLEYDIRVEDLSATGTQDYTLRAGFCDSNSTDCANGVYFEYDLSVDTHWRTKTAAASSRTATNTSITVAADTWVRLTMDINAAGSSVVFSIDGTPVKTETLTMPTLTVTPMLQIIESTGASPRFVYIDYFKFDETFTTPR